VTDCAGRHGEIVLRLPPWLAADIPDHQEVFLSDESKVRLAIDLARRNVEQRTGGPFGAAVFERGSGRLVAAGVNQVETSNCALAHAEMIAIALAQQAVGCYDLGAAGFLELATSTEPCAMCLGAIAWSGLRRVVCSARDEDAAAIGFDEGAKPADWVGALRQRGIEVARDVLREEAQAILQEYARRGGLIYNPGRRA
jgi:tRNA(Arg) A34 adenosine deaminase TadA